MFPCSRHIHRLWQYADIVKAIKHRIFAQFQTIPPQSHIFQYINANRHPIIPSATPAIPSPSTLVISSPLVTPSIHPAPPSHPSPCHAERPHPCHFERSEKSKIPAINTPAIARTLHPHPLRRSQQYLTSYDLPPLPGFLVTFQAPPCHAPSAPVIPSTRPGRSERPHLATPSPRHTRAPAPIIPKTPLVIPSAPTLVISSNFSCHFERSEKSKIPALNTPAIARTSHPSPRSRQQSKNPNHQSSIFFRNAE